jgi:hypothetical protein
MVVNSKEQAWLEANKIFPTDYDKDEASSVRAGYDIYRHRELNYYSRICDLGDRLEVLTGEYGENVTNIWIKEPELTAEEKLAKVTQPIIQKQVCEMTFAVMGYEWDSGLEKEIYRKLGGEHFEAQMAASDFVVAWCKVNGGWGERWCSVRISSIEHYGKNDGHYCITALIEETAKEEN